MNAKCSFYIYMRCFPISTHLSSWSFLYTRIPISQCIFQTFSHFYCHVQNIWDPNVHHLHIYWKCSMFHHCLIITENTGKLTQSSKSLCWWFIVSRQKVINREFEQWKLFILDKHVLCDTNHEKNEECWKTWQIAQVLFSLYGEILRHFFICIFQSLTKMAVCVCVCVCMCVLVIQSCLTLCDPMDCSPPGSSVHGILQTRILE